MPLAYANLVHAHSHVAFQGWIYTIMILMLTNFYLRPEQIQKSRYLLQFKLTCVVILGVLISFSVQGYALFSIIFSTLFQLLNYWFIYCFLRDVKQTDYQHEKDLSLRFIKTGLWLGILSTIVPLGIGISAAKGLGGSEIYASLVYTFLHLQYNGWFLFIALGLFYRFLERKQIPYRARHAHKFYWLFSVAVIPAIFLSLLGMSFSDKVLLPAWLSAGLQACCAILFVLSHLKSLKALWFYQKGWIRFYLISFLIFFPIKVLLQCLSVLPMFESLAFHNKFIILAYLHFSFIGVISFLFLGLMMDLKWLGTTGLSKVGNLLLGLGFVTSELMLASGGLGLIYNGWVMSISSAFMAIGVFCLVINRQGQFTPYGHI